MRKRAPGRLVLLQRLRGQARHRLHELQRDPSARLAVLQRFSPTALGDADQARRFAGEALQIAERFGADLDLMLAVHALIRSRVLRTVGGPEQHDELEAQIAEALEVIDRTELRGFLPLVLLERAGPSSSATSRLAPRACRKARSSSSADGTSTISFARAAACPTTSSSTTTASLAWVDSRARTRTSRPLLHCTS